MRRSRLPSDSPSIVTRPGVNRISIALWVTSIQVGWLSGKQPKKTSGGRPAFSSANMSSICFLAFSFHGGGLVLIWASWSVIFGFHTPLQSGNLAMSAQSCAVGAGLIMVGAFGGARTVGGWGGGWAALGETATIVRTARENAQEKA